MLGVEWGYWTVFAEKSICRDSTVVVESSHTVLGSASREQPSEEDLGLGGPCTAVQGGREPGVLPPCVPWDPCAPEAQPCTPASERFPWASAMQPSFSFLKCGLL